MVQLPRERSVTPRTVTCYILSPGASKCEEMLEVCFSSPFPLSIMPSIEITAEKVDSLVLVGMTSNNCRNVTELPFFELSLPKYWIRVL